MDQIKIGKFISECRKKQNLTQSQLAEKLFITDRAISKWENGRAMPDSSIMLKLCEILNITVNDLLNGEIVNDEKTGNHHVAYFGIMFPRQNHIPLGRISSCLRQKRRNI